MPTIAPLTGRDSELQIARNSLMAAAVGRGSLLLVSGPAGIGKTRFLEEVAAEAKGRGFSTGVGVAFAESLVLYHAWNEALKGLNLDHLLREEPPPRLLALYVVSQAGLPVARAERPGFSEDPALLAMMLNNASEFLRDAIRPDAGAAEGNLMRMAVGGRGVCIARGRSMALLAVYEGRETEIFLREVRHLLDDVMQRAGQRMENWDGNRRAVADLGEPLVASMMSGSFDGVDLAADGQARKFNLFDNVLFGLRRRSRIQPLLVILDDLQWAESSSLGLLHYVVRNTKDAPVLLIGAFRSEERETRPQLREALAAIAREDLGDEMFLPRLLPEDTKTMAKKMLGAHKVPAEFFERLAKETEGNPLIVREVVRQLQDTGALAVDPADGLVALTRPLARLEVPTKIREAVANRVAGLDSADRELLDAAAVCGTRFSSNLLAQVVDQPELAVARRLNFLSRRNGLVLPEAGAWRFDHPVVREVVYDAIPGDLRVLLHREAAQILAEARGDEGAIGEHFAEAGDPRAVDPLESAARGATERGAPYEAARLLEKAVRVAPRERQAALELAHAQALEFAAHYDEALAAVENAAMFGADATKCALLRGAVLLDQSKYDDVLLVVESGLPGIRGVDAAKLLTLRARAYVGLALFDEADIAARKAMGQAPDEDVLERANALMPLATAVWYRGGHAPALELFNEALRLRESKGDRRGVCEALLGIGGLQGDIGETQRALEFLRLALALSEKIGDRRLAAASRFNVSNALIDLGELEGSLREARRAFEAAEAIGNERLMAWSEFIEGLVMTRRGKPQDALIILDRAARRARKEGEQRLLSTALSESVPPLLLLGEKRRALRDAAEALEIARAAGAKMVEAVALRAQAEAAGADGDLEGMERYFDEAKSLFETLRNTIETAETHARWADAMRAAGKPEEARAHWSQALRLFESRHLRRRSGPVRAALVALPS